MVTLTELKLSFDIAPGSGIAADMADEAPAKFLPRMQDLADAYDISLTGLTKLASKYNLSRFDLAGPDDVYEKLVRIGDRRGAMVRRLSDPEIREAIWEKIMGLEWEEQIP